MSLRDARAILDRIPAIAYQLDGVAQVLVKQGHTGYNTCGEAPKLLHPTNQALQSTLGERTRDVSQDI